MLQLLLTVEELMCLAEPLVASLTAQSDQSVFCRLARWESPGFTCRSAAMTLGSPAPQLPGTGEGSKLTGTCHHHHYFRQSGLQMPLEVGVFGAFQVGTVALVQGRNG